MLDEYFNYLFPGYHLLSEEQRKKFEETDAGKKFIEVCSDLKANFPQSIWYQLGLSNFGVAVWNRTISLPWISRMEYQPIEPMDVARQKLIGDKRELIISKIGQDEDFLNLEKNLVKVILEKILPDYRFYEPLFQDELAENEFSKELLKIAGDINHKDKESQDKVKAAREALKHQINLPFIPKSFKLSRYMPFLMDNQKKDIDAIAKEDDLKKYIHTLIEKNFGAIFHVQEEKLNEFNKDSISELADLIYQAFDNTDKLNYDEFFNAYRNKLVQHLNKDSLLTQENGAPLINDSLNVFLSALFNDLSTIKNYIDKASDAHTFIQSVGGGCQGDNFILGFVDIYNSARYANDIETTKKTLLSLFSPLQPLTDEYKLIAHEKNLFLKILKILFPLLIVSVLVVLTSLLLTPLALPELVLAILIIPTLIISVVIAAQAVRLKNEVYGFLREKWYGGPFLIPEFQVNQRMQDAFAQDAEKIRQFYIDEIQASNDLENTLQTMLDSGSLTNEQLQQKSKNLENRCVLYVEWSLIHSNFEVGIEQARSIVSKRLISNVAREQAKLDSENKDLITKFAEEARDKLAHHFKNAHELNRQPSLNFFKPADNPSLAEIKTLHDSLVKASSP